MKAYINEKLKLVIKNVETDIEINDDVLNKIELQTDRSYLILVDNKLIFNTILSQSINELRKIRDEKIAYLDYYVLSDTTGLTTTAERTAIKSKRQYIRDITEGLTTVEEALKKIKELNKLV